MTNVPWFPYLVAIATIFAINLLPAFGPPTWAVLVLLKLHFGLSAVPLVLTGAVAAACGRLVLAHGASAVGGRLSPARRQSLAAVGDRISHHRVGSAASVGLFALSPVPSGQLFVAAGLLQVPLVVLTGVFFAGRLISYAGYVGAASVLNRSASERALDSFRSPLGVLVQLVLLSALAVGPSLLTRKWGALTGRTRSHQPVQQTGTSSRGCASE